VVDGAHALGQFPVNVGDIGCDAYVGCGHKWLLGPQGTSLAYVAKEHLETFKPSWIGWGAQVEFSLDLASQSFVLQDSSRRFEFGTKQWALFPGLGRAIAFVNEIGIPVIRDRTHQLAKGLKQMVDSVPAWRRLTPADPNLSTGIVSIELDENTPENLKELLWERHRLLVAYWHPRRLLRLSVAFFTTQTEIEGAFKAIHALTTGSL
jgi:selenocysteine lyase/cysteine desulfurase